MATKAQIHNLADKLDIPWDNDPKFKRWSRKVTGKSCLDSMSKADLGKLLKALKARETVNVKTYSRSTKGWRMGVKKYVRKRRTKKKEAMIITVPLAIGTALLAAGMAKKKKKKKNKKKLAAVFSEAYYKEASAYGSPSRAAYNQSLNKTQKERASLREVPWYRPFKKKSLKDALGKRQKAIAAEALPETKRSWKAHKELLKSDKIPNKATDRYTENDIAMAKAKKLRDSYKSFATRKEYVSALKKLQSQYPKERIYHGR